MIEREREREKKIDRERAGDRQIIVKESARLEILSITMSKPKICVKVT